MKTYPSNSPAETEALGAQLAKRLKPGDVVALYGPLGAGKTAFARGVLRALGYGDHAASPTFAIVNEYRGQALDVAHFDMYRIASEEELYSTGFYDYLDGHTVLLIEWSENIEWAIEEDAVRVTISRNGDLARDIRIEGGGL